MLYRSTILVAFMGAAFLVMACEDEHAMAPPRVAEEQAPAQVAVESPEPQATVETPEAPPSDTEPPREPPTSNIVWGKLSMMMERLEDADHEEVEGPYMILSEIAAQPKPDGEPTGYVYVHSGHWEMRVIREVPTEITTAHVADRDRSSEVQIARALEVHAFHPRRFNDSGDSGERTFFALELRNSPDGQFIGVAGVPRLDVYSLRREDMSTPASPEQVALVRESDNLAGWDPPLDPDDFRVRDFPDLRISVVAGLSAWIVRDGVVLNESTPGVLYRAGPLTVFSMSSTNEGWLTALEGLRHVPKNCVVHDPSGTPLNIRRAPRRGADVVRTLANDAQVQVFERRGSWLRVSQSEEAVEWAHASGVRCPRTAAL